MEFGPQYETEDVVEPDLYERLGDTVTTIMGKTGTLTELAEKFCPKNLKDPAITLEMKNTFVVKVINDKGLEIDPDLVATFDRTLNRLGIERNYVLRQPEPEDRSSSNETLFVKEETTEKADKNVFAQEPISTIQVSDAAVSRLVQEKIILQIPDPLLPHKQIISANTKQSLFDDQSVDSPLPYPHYSDQEQAMDSEVLSVLQLDSTKSSTEEYINSGDVITDTFDIKSIVLPLHKELLDDVLYVPTEPEINFVQELTDLWESPVVSIDGQAEIEFGYQFTSELPSEVHPITAFSNLLNTLQTEQTFNVFDEYNTVEQIDDQSNTLLFKFTNKLQQASPEKLAEIEPLITHVLTLAEAIQTSVIDDPEMFTTQAAELQYLITLLAAEFAIEANNQELLEFICLLAKPRSITVSTLDIGYIDNGTHEHKLDVVQISGLVDIGQRVRQLLGTYALLRTHRFSF